MHRRDFLASAATAALAPLPTPKPAGPGPLCFFSKHLPRMTPAAMARALKSAGFGAIELTVRPGGHVSPENVQTTLPKAIEAIRAEGLEVPVIATALTSADDKSAWPLLSTAAKLGVRVFRCGWIEYHYTDVRSELRTAGA